MGGSDWVRRSHNERLIYFNYDCIQDVSPRRGDSPMHHSIDVTKLTACEGFEKEIVSSMWHGKQISLRALSNNLDGDNRAKIYTPENRFCFGELLYLAGWGYLIEILDDPYQIPTGYEYLMDDYDVSELGQDYDMALERFMDLTNPEACSYLFGRSLQREQRHQNDELVEVMHSVALEAQWEALVAVKDALDGPTLLNIFESVDLCEGYLSGCWNNDTIEVVLHYDASKGSPDRLLQRFR